MNRLIFCPGVCQIMNAAAALDQDHGPERGSQEDVLVLFGRSAQSPVGMVMEEIARTVWPWREIRWADDVIIWYFPTRRFAPVAREVLNKRLPDADEIWVSKLCMDSTKLILYAFPGASVTLYEDGTEEFIPQEITCGRSRWRSLPPTRWLGAAKREISHWNARPECMEAGGVCARDLRRIKTMYSFLADMVGLPNYLSGLHWKRVEREKLLARYETLAALAGADARMQPPREGAAPPILFLSQPFATIFLTVEDEYALYCRAIKILQDKGYTILWKEHPQESTSLAPRLKEELGEHCIQVVGGQQRVPVESLVRGWDLAGVVSVSSTALFYLQGLYGYPAYTATDCIDADRWRQRTELEVNRLCRRTLAPLDQLPNVKG